MLHSEVVVQFRAVAVLRKIIQGVKLPDSDLAVVLRKLNSDAAGHR
jgi:hypothetical protein